MAGVVRCKVCGSFVQGEDRFCWSCGSKLAAGDASSAAPSAVQEKEASQEVQFALRRAFLAQRRNDPAEAERIVREALAREPQSIAALAMLSEILRAKGDLVAAVDAAHQATEAASALGVAPKGALQRAREARARIEQSVVEDVLDRRRSTDWNPLSLFTIQSAVWHQSGRFFLALAGAGLFCLLLALISVLRGGAWGYVWFATSLGAAGWCYYDADARREMGLFWGPFVLCLGPFGLAIYLLTRF